MPSPVSLLSKLPDVGTTIFTVMSKLATEHGALNLSQGFPNFEVASGLVRLLNKFAEAGHHQYAPMAGVMELREGIATKTEALYNITYDPETEVTITSGATEALFSAIAAVVRSGDEVIIFEPAYDSYAPAVRLNGGIPVFVTLNPPEFSIPWEEVREKINDSTRLVIVNTPHNPTGTVWSAGDLDTLASIIRNKDIFLLGDEVYEHIIFDGQTHHSLLTNPELKERSFICGSFGKTFHITGWKVGYCLAPRDLSAEFRKIHQYLTFSTFTPAQYALAAYLKTPDHYLQIPEFYQKKRDYFLEGLQASRLDFIPSDGTFFQNVNYSRISDEADTDLAVRLTREIGVASIPLSVFYHRPTDHRMLRFCFAKDEETLKRATERLSKL